MNQNTTKHFNHHSNFSGNGNGRGHPGQHGHNVREQRDRRDNFDQQPRMGEDMLAEKVIAVGRKELAISRRKNVRGQFLRIDERRFGSNRPIATVIIPIEGFDDFLDALEEICPEEEA